MDVGERIVTHIAPVVVECEKKNYEIVFLGILKKVSISLMVLKHGCLFSTHNGKIRGGKWLIQPGFKPCMDGQMLKWHPNEERHLGKI